MLIERPWGRVNDPTPIPAPIDADTFATMDELDFAVLIRDHLVPRQPNGAQRQQWNALWDLLGADETLSERTFDVLDDFLDTTEAAIQADELDEAQTKRAAKFQHFCNDAWKRLQADDKPLGWAGRTASGFNPAARKVIAQLVDAIDEHRRELTSGEARDDADNKLWKTLREVGLDPHQRRR